MYIKYIFVECTFYSIYIYKYIYIYPVPTKDMQTPLLFRNGYLYMKDAQCATRNENHISDFSYL